MRRILLTAALLTAAATAPCQEPELRGLQALEHRLARTPPVSTPFVEYRFSHLLKKPLRSSGTLEYRADGVLVRNVLLPSPEITEVDGDQVRVTRAGKPTRTLALQHAPQLRVLLGSFRALLEGHLTPLQQDFDLGLEENASLWTLTLKPRDATLAKHLARIVVYGAENRPLCMEALEPDGDGAMTLFAAEARDKTATPALADLERSCRAPVARGQP